MANKNNPFAMYATKTKKANIKAMGGEEIEYREITMDEDDSFRKMMIKGFDKDGKPELDVDKYTEVRYHKVAACMLNPKMSVEELKALPKSAEDAINEIAALISGDTEEEEGN